MSEFVGFPKIKRYWNASVTITEKIDGTNAALVFDDDGELYCQSRNRVITPGKQTDNAGFAGWAHDHDEELFEFFGPGRHFGEWWGVGIQRGYNMVERRFSPFNSHVFHSLRPHWPSNCAPIPVIGQTTLDKMAGYVSAAMTELADEGSYAAPGFMDPEGTMIFCDAFGYLKVPFDPKHKNAAADAIAAPSRGILRAA